VFLRIVARTLADLLAGALGFGRGHRSTRTFRYAFHCLRHAAASAWIKQRVDLRRLTTWLGHSSVQITLDTYGHLIKDEQGDAALVAAAQAELLA
jgi:integrase